MGAVVFNTGPPAAVYCICRPWGPYPPVGQKGHRHSRNSPALTGDGWVSGHLLLLPGKMHLGWCNACSQMRAVREFCSPHLFFCSPPPPRQLHWCVSVPALFVLFIQCGYLWALNSAEQCFECNFFRGIWAWFSFSRDQVHLPGISP